MIANYTLKSMFLMRINVYSFHWQDKNGDLIVRWDNAPHYRNIKTFPHYKHTKNVLKNQTMFVWRMFKIY
ncbi:toxin-antitoxin system TumE family protein [Methanocaldococcus sp.]